MCAVSATLNWAELYLSGVEMLLGFLVENGHARPVPSWLPPIAMPHLIH